MALILRLPERDRKKKRACLPLHCTTKHTVIMHIQACLELWGTPSKKSSYKKSVLEQLHSCRAYEHKISNGHLLPDHRNNELLYCGVNFHTQEKGFLCSLLLLSAITLLLLSNLSRIKPRSRIQKGKRANRQQKTK